MTHKSSKSSELDQFTEICGSGEDSYGISSTVTTDIEIKVSFAKVKQVKGNSGIDNNEDKAPELRICIQGSVERQKVKGSGCRDKKARHSHNSPFKLNQGFDFILRALRTFINILHERDTLAGLYFRKGF